MHGKGRQCPAMLIALRQGATCRVSDIWNDKAAKPVVPLGCAVAPARLMLRDCSPLAAPSDRKEGSGRNQSFGKEGRNMPALAPRAAHMG